jgi:hypothetical protein
VLLRQRVPFACHGDHPLPSVCRILLDPAGRPSSGSSQVPSLFPSTAQEDGSICAGEGECLQSGDQASRGAPLWSHLANQA